MQAGPHKKSERVAVAQDASGSGLAPDDHHPIPSLLLYLPSSSSLVANMASLLERMSRPAGSGPSVGPVRAKSNRAAAASAAAPYVIVRRSPPIARRSTPSLSPDRVQLLSLAFV